MKAKELIKLLKDSDSNAEVILQKDGEGNGYSPLSGVDTDAVYIPETTWSGEVFSTDWSAEEACMYEEEWQELCNEPHCVVLFPVN